MPIYLATLGRQHAARERKSVFQRAIYSTVPTYRLNHAEHNKLRSKFLNARPKRLLGPFIRCTYIGEFSKIRRGDVKVYCIHRFLDPYRSCHLPGLWGWYDLELEIVARSEMAASHSLPSPLSICQRESVARSNKKVAPRRCPKLSSSGKLARNQILPLIKNCSAMFKYVLRMIYYKI